MTHRYTLEPYQTPKSRYVCPRCQHRNKTFKRYIDTQTGNYLAGHVGRCDREDNCGYHYTPREYFRAMPYNKPDTAFKPTAVTRPKPHSVLPPYLVQQSCTHYERNNFALFLSRLFEPDLCHELTALYRIGTSIHWPGSTVFWQIDVNGKVRTGKVMLYNRQTGKRVKEPFNHIAWVHNLVGKSVSRESPKDNEATLTSFRTSGLSDFPTPFYLKQCFFGEHLLNNNPQQSVAIVESEKTAIIAAGFMPEYTWLAAGSLHGLNTDKCQVLRGRKVILFPDANGYSKWRAKACELNREIIGARFYVSEWLEGKAGGNEKGVDLADVWVGTRSELKIEGR